MLVETVIGSSYLEKSEPEISFNWKSHLLRFLKLLNCSEGLVGNVNEAVLTALPPF